MKRFFTPLLFVSIFIASSCDRLDDFAGNGDNGEDEETPAETGINFNFKNTIQVGGEGTAEISAFDPLTNKLFVVNVEVPEISTFDLSDINNVVRLNPIICVLDGTPNSVAVSNGKLAVALEAPNSQKRGHVELFDTDTQGELGVFTVGSLPDMVTFTPDGNHIVVANEGEPNEDYTIDPQGTVSIISVDSGEVTNLDFVAFNGQEANLEAAGFRVFGPDATLDRDVEPEFVTISDDSRTAWVSLQENNGVAVVNLETKQIESILPLGFKDFSLPGNEIDPSNRDDRTALRSVPVFGMYQPDAIAYYSVNGQDFFVTANEGDGREYEGNPGFEEVDRGDDFLLDETVFPDAATLQLEENLGRLELTNTMGDIDGDGDFDQLFAFGARSFSIWSGQGQLVFDSGNEIAEITLERTPEAFNGGIGDVDSRSDDAGAEPEAVSILKIGERQILFVGLERNNQVMVYDITNPSFPEFIQLLSNAGDVGPEGVLPIAAEDSPTGRDLLVVSNEVSGTVTIYEN